MKPPEEPNYLVLVPFDPREAMTLRQAAARAGKSETTVRNWCLNRGIGRRVAGGVWLVSKPALEMLLDGDDATLLAYHSGDRSSPVVRAYFERTGTPIKGPHARLSGPIQGGILRKAKVRPIRQQPK